LQRKEATQQSSQEKIPESLIEDHLPIVESVASSLASGGKLPPGVVFNDLVSWGIEGLIKAHFNFKNDKGTQFKTYAFYRIRGEILDRIRREWSYRNPTDYRHHQDKIKARIAEVAAEQLDVIREDDGTERPDEKVNDLIANSAVVYLLSLDDVEIVSNLSGTRDPAIEIIDEVEAHQDREALWEEIQHLNEEEKKIVELFYIQGYKQKDIADELKLSRSKVCRIHMKILEKLRRRLQRRFA